MIVYGMGSAMIFFVQVLGVDRESCGIDIVGYFWGGFVAYFLLFIESILAYIFLIKRLRKSLRLYIIWFAL